MTGAQETLQIKKYSNRRLYDQTHGRHLTHQELFDMVARGVTVSVTDGGTGQDITNVVLAQVLLERDPLKLAAFPPAVMHQIIRASDQMLSTFTARYLGQMIEAYATMQRQIESLVGRGGPGAPHAQPPPVAQVPAAIFDWAMSMARPPVAGAAGAPASAPANEQTADDAVRALADRIDSLTRQLEELRTQAAARKARPARPGGRSSNTPSKKKPGARRRA